MGKLNDKVALVTGGTTGIGAATARLFQAEGAQVIATGSNEGENFMKIGFVSLPLSGHLNPMTALARKLQSRGHEVQFFGIPDIESLIRAASLTFVPYGEQEYPIGSLTKLWSPVAQLRGLELMRYTVEETFSGLLETAFRHLPGKLVEAGIDALVIDTAYFFVQLIPMGLDMPFVQIWNVLPRDSSGTTPPSWFSWRLESTPEALARNVEGLKQVGTLFVPVLPIARAYAESVGLEIDWKNPSSFGSKGSATVVSSELSIMHRNYT